MRFLRQATSVDVPIGPFLDETDGKTAETALTITQPDVRLKKNGGNWAQKAAAQTLSHEESGWYEVTLDATDTDTCGHLIVAIHESGALPVWCEFTVIEEAIYDALFAASANAFSGAAGSTTLTALASGSITAAVIATGAIDADAIADNAIDAGAIAADAITSAKIADNAITAAKLAADCITAAKVADGTIDAATFAAGAINNAACSFDGSELTAVPWNAAWDAEVQSEVEDALVVHRLDELLTADSDIDGAAPPTTGSVFFELMSKTTNSFTFDQTTDSLEAVRDKAADIETDTQDIQGRLPAALVSGRIDASVGAMAANTLTASALAADAVTEIQAGLSTLDAAGVRTAVGLASANLDTQLAAIDDYIDTEMAAIKAKTDSLTFTVAGKIDCNILYVNGVQIDGTGTTGDPWGPV